MSVRVSGKQMEIGETFRQRIEDRIRDAVTKYFDGGYSGQVVVTKSQSRFAADCLVHLDTGANLHAAGEANDPQVAFDTAFERVEKRLRRYNRKLKQHRKGNGVNGVDGVTAQYTVFGASDELDELDEDYAPPVIAETTKSLRQMSVEEAVMELDFSGQQVVMFRHAGHGGLNVVYRRADGNIGWIDPALGAN